MKQWLGIENSDGAAYHAYADDSESAFRAIGKAMGMDTTKADFDTGNVDVDLYELRPLPSGVAKKLELED